MQQNFAGPPPRLSDLHGAERVQALRARAAADRDRYLQKRDAGRASVGMVARWISRLAG
jgi:hypothetical protein